MVSKCKLNICHIILITYLILVLLICPTDGLVVVSSSLLKPKINIVQVQVAQSSSFVIGRIKNDIIIGCKQRIAADTQFISKSFIEILVAACTQLVAEIKVRGSIQHIISEIDFVTSGIVTAIVGKYISMWKTAPTKNYESNESNDKIDDTSSQQQQQQQQQPDNNNSTARSTTTTTRTIFGRIVPTNAFQLYLIDGRTKPTIVQRIGSILQPMPSLAYSGFIASSIGYGLTALFITVRTILIPSYIAKTQNVNILYASIYTGIYMALSSNIRYQLLQGIVEPFVEKYTKQRSSVIRNILIVAIRIGNGFIGSYLAITGMRLLGLQRLK